MIYKTKGTCSTMIDVELKDGVIDSVKFTGGCNGNLQGISALVKGMKPEEVLCAVTLNAACSVGMGDKVGTVEAGKQGDLVIWDAPDLDMILYRFGSNLCRTVIKKGRVAHEKG